MNRIKNLDVFFNQKKVGILALYKSRLAAFQYDDDWIAEGFSISPFSLPLGNKVFIPKADPFDGLYGVFADSLPDGWGRLLVDRILLKERLNPNEIDEINRLALVGESGMGALCYRPAHDFSVGLEIQEFDRLALECKKVLESKESDDLDTLFLLGGSSGGARPKILTEYQGEEWLIKFPSSADNNEIGVQEYAYAQCAALCGIEVAKTRLFPSKYCGGYFGTQRFDRVRNKDGKMEKMHMVSVSALLETSHRIPNLDYHILMKLTMELTKDFSEVEKMFRLMCFNVFAHNRDDHSKNFSFLYHMDQKRWKLSPAYDLTYSNSIGGEHATCVNGNGRNPDMDDILAVAAEIGLSRGKAKKIAGEIREIVAERLREFII